MDSLKNILAIVDIHDYNVLDSIAIDNLKDYIMENKTKAIEILGIYQKDETKNYDSFDSMENDLKSNLEMLKYSYISNKEQKIEETLTFEIFSNNMKSIDAKFNYGENSLEIKLKTNTFNKKKCLSPKLNIKTNKIFPNFSKKEPTKKKTKQISSSKNLFNHSDCTNTKNKQILEIKGFRDFGLLLLIPFEYKKKFSLEDIRNKLFLIWISIGSHVKLSVTEIIYNFDLFINEIMNRRERNIKNWITNLTSSFEDKNINALKNLNISLNEKWKICKETCSFCYYKCTKISGHIEEHDCGFDHICHEEC